jgi:hypothetical protein
MRCLVLLSLQLLTSIAIIFYVRRLYLFIEKTGSQDYVRALVFQPPVNLR